MKYTKCLFYAVAVLSTVCALPIGVHAADYSFVTDGTPEYYASTSYEETYGSQYNYGGPNVVDYQIPELEYGVLSTTQTGVMEKALLPGLQQMAATGDGGDYGVSGSGAPIVLPDTAGNSGAALPGLPAFTELDHIALLSNGAIGKISIPAIGVKSYYLWEGETAASMKKGLGHYSSSSVWDGNVAVCGHNRGAKYVIGAIKDLSIGDTITYTTSQGTRTYAVSLVEVIASSDWSYLQATTDNRITFTTCLANQPDMRVCVQAVEVDTKN